MPDWKTAFDFQCRQDFRKMLKRGELVFEDANHVVWSQKKKETQHLTVDQFCFAIWEYWANGNPLFTSLVSGQMSSMGMNQARVKVILLEEYERIGGKADDKSIDPALVAANQVEHELHRQVGMTIKEKRLKIDGDSVAYVDRQGENHSFTVDAYAEYWAKRWSGEGMEQVTAQAIKEVVLDEWGKRSS